MILANRSKYPESVSLDNWLGFINLSQQGLEPIDNILLNRMVIRTNNKSLEDDQTGHSVFESLNDNILVDETEHLLLHSLVLIVHHNLN